MPYHYSNPKRESDPHALPDIETFELAPRDWNKGLCPFCPDDYGGTPTCGKDEHDRDHVGWYWQSCFPGCMPDGEPNGPFDTEEDALEDAQSESAAGEDR